jgi:predicted nucleic acid-binding protein
MTVATDRKALVDTNVLVYCYNADAPAKTAVATELVRQLIDADRIVLSAQNLNEFYVAVTKPTKPDPMPPAEARKAIEYLSRAAEVIDVDASMSLAAIDAVLQHQLSFWDALIWAAAKRRAVPIIYSEDFQHGRVLDGVQFINPFLSPPS